MSEDPVTPALIGNVHCKCKNNRCSTGICSCHSSKLHCSEWSQFTVACLLKMAEAAHVIQALIRTTFADGPAVNNFRRATKRKYYGSDALMLKPKLFAEMKRFLSLVEEYWKTRFYAF
ncbi:hypothetical protein AVEN_78573-1 [Araneus ventricosus]|uniref:Tesmin/TSO1-like CXC domain-containing protein n=1 Tax=Araneus ventricosus TaxID=182803 RepID=A0A4Y2LCK8_ARAVE|nr:hypothetical protein AVEN_78573-1 [Araneus ventricosus]